MSEQSVPSLDQAMELARCLEPRDQVRLVAQLVAILADARQGPSALSSDAWEAWASIRTAITEHATVSDANASELPSSASGSKA